MNADRPPDREARRPFVIGGWDWDARDRTLTCRYRQDPHDFHERFVFDVPPARVDVDEELARAFDLLACTAGVSYYKVAAAERVVVEGVVDRPCWRPYLEALYDEGLREFSFVNALSVPFAPAFDITTGRLPCVEHPRQAGSDGIVLPMGGGRDSLLVAHALRDLAPLLLTVGENPIVARQAASLGLRLTVVERRLDPLMLDLNRQGALNGHVPVTAINSCVAVVAGLLTGRREVVMSNERSADHPTRAHHGVPINHQYSKSYAYELLLRSVLGHLDIRIGYSSALRAYGELAISRSIGRVWDEIPPFLSCNRAYVRSGGAPSLTWCGHCPKCAFVFIGLAPFVERARLVAMFEDDMLAARPEQALSMLLGQDRLFDCVGTEAEIAAAVRLAAEGEWRDEAALVATAARLPVVEDDELRRLLEEDTSVEQFAPAAILNRVGRVLR